MTVPPMTAQELWNELDRLRQDGTDLADLPVYVEVTDRRSYVAEQRILKKGGDGEIVTTVAAEGVAYGVVVPTGFDLSGDKPERLGEHLLLQAVEDDDRAAAPARRRARKGETRRLVHNTRELREAFEAMRDAIDDAGILLWDAKSDRTARRVPADEWFWSLAQAFHWLRLTLIYCEGYGYSVAHLSVLADMWARKHRITEQDLDTLDRSVVVPDLATMAHMTSNVQSLLGLGPQPGSFPTLDNDEEADS